MREAKIRGTFMQIPYWRLRARFRACGYRDKEAAAGVGMSAYALSSRLNGRQRWQSDEIEAVCELLEIGQEEIGELFFPEVEQNKKPAGAENTGGLRVKAI